MTKYLLLSPSLIITVILRRRSSRHRSLKSTSGPEAFSYSINAHEYSDSESDAGKYTPLALVFGLSVIGSIFLVHSTIATQRNSNPANHPPNLRVEFKSQKDRKTAPPTAHNN
ncbi:uncharacterized protein FOMMEDRAFT_160697 [Fomitiporia mediterranea MF3/22]|uniref:uncharacterized protein n=1 Tax=Fomitiporia mediterranea (strain MF3/22) TaxID=694068 RepID=UPI00044074E1|nr:uncharacterized protein FOMMEDRAFT_160697 [Fomitiporia mediterranea MF3/22]EJC99131.1 hypothetical protein FOMMEDRAFT_160697 [Fomitiporia mediterranea MF3/22]